jgi:hypothetical protein
LREQSKTSIELKIYCKLVSNRLRISFRRKFPRQFPRICWNFKEKCNNWFLTQLFLISVVSFAISLEHFVSISRSSKSYILQQLSMSLGKSLQFISSSLIMVYNNEEILGVSKQSFEYKINPTFTISETRKIPRVILQSISLFEYPN